jgi:hypothetical protein
VLQRWVTQRVLDGGGWKGWKEAGGEIDKKPITDYTESA